MTIIDTASRYATLYYMSIRQQILNHLTTPLRLIKTQHGTPLRIITTDNACEYINKAVQQLYGTHGIQLRPSTPYFPQENGISKRMKHTLLAAARASLHHNKLPDSYWEDSVSDAVFKYSLTMHHTTG